MFKSHSNAGLSQAKQHQQNRQTQNQGSESKLVDVPSSNKMPVTNDSGKKSSTKPGSARSQNNSRAGAIKQPKHKRFCLHSIDDVSLNSVTNYIAENSLNRFKTCVVTVVSKSPINDLTRDMLVLNALTSNGNQHSKYYRNYFEERSHNSSPPISSVEEAGYEIQVVGHADFDNGLVIMTVDSFMNSDKLLNLCNFIPDDCPKKSKDSAQTFTHPLLDVWPKWNQDLIKTLLILFSLSHVIVFYNPEPTIDYGLLQTLKILEALRMKSMTRISDLLETIASGQVFSQQWIRDCRIACPLALFLCDTSGYQALEKESHNKLADETQEQLEEHIYLLLKRSNLLSASQKSLLSIPSRDGFVLLTSCHHSHVPVNPSTSSSDIEVQRLNELHPLPESIAELTITECEDKLKQSNESMCLNKLNRGKENGQVQLHGQLRRFLNKHISNVRTSTAQDHDHRQAGKQHSPVIMPRFDDFFNVLLRLKCLLFPVIPSSSTELIADSRSFWLARDERKFADIYDLIDIDNSFSQRHCCKAQAAAFELYVRNLQSLPIDESIHRESLDTAIKYYKSQARGSASRMNLKFLEDQCERHWSEEGLPTLNSIHRDRTIKTRSSKQLNKTLPSSSSNTRSSPQQGQNAFDREKEHALCLTRKPNGVVVTVSCDCGRESSLLIKPNDRKKKLERVDIYRIND